MGRAYAVLLPILRACSQYVADVTLGFVQPLVDDEK